MSALASAPRTVATARALSLLLLAGCPRSKPPGQPQGPPVAGCDLDAPAEGPPGERVLALVVGVSDYQADGLPDLAGAAGDARAFAALLLGPYGVPAANVCLLTDAAATVQGFTTAFERALVQRASPGDAAVIFFAGHGSSAYDEPGGDEADGWDNTLVLSDSRVGSTQDLVDDQLAMMLGSLQARTTDITLLVDACSSGTIARGDERAPVRVRRVPPALAAMPPAGAQPPAAAKGARLTGWSLGPGITTLSAAADGTDALEPANGGRGFFTAALLDTLQDSLGASTSWATIFDGVQRRLAVSARDQRPFQQGQGSSAALRPGAAAQTPRRTAPIAARPPEIRVLDEHRVGSFKRCGEDLFVLPPEVPWHIEVVNRAAEPMRFKGALLAASGEVLALPVDDLTQELQQDSAVLLTVAQTIQLNTPPGTPEPVVVVGQVGGDPPRLTTSSAALCAPASARATVWVMVSEEPDRYDCADAPPLTEAMCPD